MKKIFPLRGKAKWVILIVICCILLPISASAEPAASQNTKPLLFLGNQNLPPMVYLENGLPSGIIVDITAALGEKMGRAIDIKAMNWADAQKIVEQGGADALIQINVTEERKKIFDFSEPLLESKFSIFTLAGRTGISGAAGLRGLRVGVETEGFPSVVLQTDPLIQLVNTSSILEAFNMLKEGGVDVVIADEWVGTYILAKNKINSVLIIGDPITKLESSIAVKKGNTELLAAIDKGLQEIKKDGTYQRILEKWKPKEVVFQTLDQIKLNQYEMVLGALGLLFLVSIVWGILLFRQLSKTEKMRRMLAEAHQRLSDVITGTNVGTWEWNIQTGKIAFNVRCAEIMGYALEEMASLNIETLPGFVHPEDLEKLENQLNLVFAKEIDYYDIEYRMKHKTDGWVWVDSRGKVISWAADGKPLLMSGMFIDISERKQAEAESYYLSCHDQLTGLYNRRFYEEELKRLDTERNLPLTIAMGDVNGLKLINDSFGHAFGDEILKKVAEVITKGCRADDVIARLGGDEFSVILPKTNAAEAEKVLAHIEYLLSNEKVGSIDISISFGYETKDNEKENIQETIKNTEDHMYRHKLYESSSMRSKIIGLIMNTLYEKNNREMLHSKRVSEICQAIANKMNLDKDEVNQIRIAGLMHDIGKIGIDEKILNKPDKLDEDEWKEIQRHPEVGYRILNSVSEFSEIAGDILSHHERWDGKGYPKGLKAFEIPLRARIIAVADSYDAMTVGRAYKEALSEEEAVNEIIRCSGTQFDAHIASVFIEKVLGEEQKHNQKIQAIT